MLSVAIVVSDIIVESDIVDESVVDVVSSAFLDWQAAAKETIVATNNTDFTIRFMRVVSLCLLDLVP
ncbi:hypothetical protein GCM10027347_11820 [Larkinella harenae]